MKKSLKYTVNRACRHTFSVENGPHIILRGDLCKKRYKNSRETQVKCMFSFAIALQKPEAQIVWKMKMPNRRVGRGTFYLFYASFVQIEHFILRFLVECKSKSFTFQPCSGLVLVLYIFY